MTASLNSILATSARVYLPAWGVWYAEVDLDGDALDLLVHGATMPQRRVRRQPRSSPGPLT